MQPSEAYLWLRQSLRRQRIIKAFTQPLTVMQLARRVSLSRKACSYVLWELTVYSLVRCLNPAARRHRVYWLTDLGKNCQRQLCKDARSAPVPHDSPELDWSLYGWLCHKQHAAVIKSCMRPMRTFEIKHKARDFKEGQRMSESNARDVVRRLETRGILTRVYVNRKPFVGRPRYELTKLGKVVQLLLFKADTKTP